jgi:hypothetical protein
MSKQRRSADQTQEQPLDRELNIRGILISTVALVTTIVVAALLMWVFISYLLDSFAAQDPPQPALLEAREPHLPPAPHLQTDPFVDLIELRAEEERVLTSYGWVDQHAGVAHLPIDRAMDLVVERGSVEPASIFQPEEGISSKKAEGSGN